MDRQVERISRQVSLDGRKINGQIINDKQSYLIDKTINTVKI